MKFMKVSRDGGPDSGVVGFWLFEIKSLFSIVVLRFDGDRREAFHSHAFNAITWWLSGEVNEHHINGQVLNWKSSFIPKWTPRHCIHKIYPVKRTYALSIRGPWNKQWLEYNPNQNETTIFTHGRKVVNRTKGSV